MGYTFIWNDQKEAEWRELAELEPQLQKLYEEAKSYEDKSPDSYSYVNGIFYDKIRPKVVKLVGWSQKDKAVNPQLTTSRAYDIAYEKIYNALPNCKRE